MASTASSGVNPWKRLKAPPLLRLKRNATSPNSATGPSARSWTAQVLVSWSRTTTPTTMAATTHPRTARRGRVSSTPSFGTRLAVDAHIGPRDGLEPLDGDLAARVRADAVRTL